MSHRVPVRGHPVRGLHGPERCHVLVRSLVPHDSYGPNWKQHHKGLPDISIQAGFADLFHGNGICLLQQRYAFGRDLSEDSHSQSRTGKGMSPEDHFRHTELRPQVSHLIFEKLSEGLDQLQVHLFGQTAHVMVAFYSSRRATLERDALYNVRIKSPLSQEAHVRKLRSLGLKYPYKLFTNNFPFLFRVRDSLKLSQETIRC